MMMNILNVHRRRKNVSNTYISFYKYKNFLSYFYRPISVCALLLLVILVKPEPIQSLQVMVVDS